MSETDRLLRSEIIKYISEFSSKDELIVWNPKNYDHIHIDYDPETKEIMGLFPDINVLPVRPENTIPITELKPFDWVYMKILTPKANKQLLRKHKGVLRD
jgi:hypothetical protein